MITIATAVEKIIRRKPFLEEALSQKIINLSSLARLIVPEVEKLTLKKVKTSAIVMALKRKSKNIGALLLEKRVLKEKFDLITRSNLIEFTIFNSDFSSEKHKKIIETAEKSKKYFLTITQGVFETTVIASQDLKEKIEKILKKDKIISQFENLSSITLQLPKETALTPGVYYSILKVLAWEGINVVEVVSTFSEFTIILKEKEVIHAYSLFRNILK